MFLKSRFFSTISTSFPVCFLNNLPRFFQDYCAGTLFRYSQSISAVFSKIMSGAHVSAHFKNVSGTLGCVLRNQLRSSCAHENLLRAFSHSKKLQKSVDFCTLAKFSQYNIKLITCTYIEKNDKKTLIHIFSQSMLDFCINKLNFL